MSLGEKLRKLRLKEKRTLQAQSELCGVKLNTVFRWEHDMAKPKEAELERIAELHGIPAAWLSRDCDANNSAESGNIDQQLFSLFEKLSDSQKYMILGYIERVCAEGLKKTE